MAALATVTTDENRKPITKVENSHNLEDSGPFKATQLWYRIISYLKNHANLKRRWSMIRQYDNCFTGENAVNVVYHCLVEERKSSTVITGEITRIKAKKVCQSLMDNGVFEAVGNKSRGSNFVHFSVFQDSSAKLYQFIEAGRNREVYVIKDADQESGKHSTSMEEEELTNCGVVGISTDVEEVQIQPDSLSISTPSKLLSTPSRWSACVSPFRRLQSQVDDDDDDDEFDGDSSQLSRARQSPDSPSSLTPTGSRRRSASASGRMRGFGRVFRALASSDVVDTNGGSASSTMLESPKVKTKNGKPNLLRFQRLLSSSSTSLLTDDGSFSSPTLDEDSVWKQVALSRLLTLLDLSFLDDILPSPKKKLPRPSSVSNCLIVPNHHRLLSKADSAPAFIGHDGASAELWVSTAQQITDSRCFLLDNPIHLSGAELKQRAFDTVWRYYSNLPSPIVPSNLISVFVAILGLVKEGRFSVAVQALQLAILMLPWQQKWELEQLLGFMQLATDDVSIRLKKQLTNRQFLLQQFTAVIVRYELLAQDQAAILISFMLHNRQLVFTTPEDVKLEVDVILLESRIRKDAVPNAAIKYCNQMTVTSYEQNTTRTSNKALEDLLNSVVDSVQMTLREKEKWLKRFRKCHPELYEKCFPRK